MPKIKVKERIKNTKPYNSMTIDQAVAGGLARTKEYWKQLQLDVSRIKLTQQSNPDIDAVSDELDREESNNEQNKTGLSEITSEKVVQPDLIGRS